MPASKFPGKSSHTKLFGILILISGVLLGVLLLRKEQDFRNKAKTYDEKVLICHKNQDGISRQEIFVNYQELKAHLNHGDLLGSCKILTPTLYKPDPRKN